jgi:hypothetical protein
MYGKNSEGYADPTAATAIAHIAHEEKSAKRRPLVYVASAYRGDVELNTERAKTYSRFVAAQGGIPFTPHLLFTQFLNDDEPEERKQGLYFGKVLLSKCDSLWAFGHISDGMLAELEYAAKRNIPIRYFDENCEEVR